jgi:NADPH-dependent curcumin reductase CurA
MGYQSPIEAGLSNLDFVIAFYQNDNMISCTLINAYTINQTRLQNVRADLINYYFDNVTTNTGNRVPTMLKISGHLTLQ